MRKLLWLMDVRGFIQIFREFVRMILIVMLEEKEK